MVDVTPMIAADRKIIQSYSKDGFRINEEMFSCPLIVFPTLVVEWLAPKNPKNLVIEDFSQIIAANNVDVLLFGGGSKAEFLSREIRDTLKSHGVIVESMDTGAACRTYNVLLAEDRNIAIAIYPDIVYK